MRFYNELILTMVFTLVASLGASEVNRNVLDYGADITGKHDNTSAFQKALDAASKANGGTVYVPAGSYFFSGNITIPSGVTLKGTFSSAPFVSSKKDLKGSVLLPAANKNNPDGKPFISMTENSTLDGFIVFYDNYIDSETNLPIAYPPCVQPSIITWPGTNNIVIKHMNFVNAYNAINLIWASRTLISDIQGFPIRNGIYIDCCFDSSRFENIHWTKQGRISDPYSEWTKMNGIAFEFGRDDFQNVQHSFCKGYKVGFKFDLSKNVPANDPAGKPLIVPRWCNGTFVGCGTSDCGNAILVDYMQMPGLMFTGCEFIGSDDPDSIPVAISSTAGSASLSFANCMFKNSGEVAISMKSQTSNLVVENSHFYNWGRNMHSSSAACIQADSGRLIFNDNTFDKSKNPSHNQIKISPNVKSAVIIGNIAKGKFNIDNEAGEKVIIKDNIGD